MCPHPNAGSPAAIAEGAGQRATRATRASASPTIPALILTPIDPVSEVLCVGALDLRRALLAVRRGVELHSRHGLPRPLRAGESLDGGIAGPSGAAIVGAAVVIGGDHLLGLWAAHLRHLDRGDV